MRLLARVDDLDVRVEFGQQRPRRELVGHDDVGLGQQPPAEHGDQARIARPAADKGDSSDDPLGAGMRHRGVVGHLLSL